MEEEKEEAEEDRLGSPRRSPRYRGRLRYDSLVGLFRVSLGVLRLSRAPLGHPSLGGGDKALRDCQVGAADVAVSRVRGFSYGATLRARGTVRAFLPECELA